MLKKILPHSIELLDVLRRAPLLLSSEAKEKISNFTSEQLTSEGGFCNRAGTCDQYYTMFGLGCAMALNISMPVKKIKQYILSSPAEDLDLVHLVCRVKSLLIIKLMRWRIFYPFLRFLYNTGLHSQTKVNAEKFRSPDGGFNDDSAGISHPYAIFMGLNLYQDCGAKIPDTANLIKALENCRKGKNTFYNPASKGQGMLLSTSAAMLTLRQLTGKVDISVLDWIAQQQGKTGGFHASPDSPMPDLLSTAVALFTLRVCSYPLDSMADSAMDFILNHWYENGGFTGTLVDDCADCEYTFYALMALGALAK